MDTSSSAAEAEADDIRGIERERLRALVDGNMDVARRLHAEDFQLVTPLGVALSKEQYLGAVAAGAVRYLVWEVDSPIDVRMHGEVALIRYQSQIEIVVQGQGYPRGRYWHTDAYERRDGHWQVVWSHATGIV